jgi:hypothetical protein
MTPMTVSPNTELCGLCGQPLDAHTSSEPGDGQAETGERIEYIVIRIRGVLADSQAADNPADTTTIMAASLAQSLKIDTASLSGQRYTCHVVPDPYGRTFSDYQLIQAPDTPS